MSHAHSTTRRHSFQHLTPIKRGQIQALLDQGIPKTKIAKAVGIARSTLYYELKRGTVEQMRSNLSIYKRYFAESGQIIYEKRRQACRKPYKLEQAREFVEHLERTIKEDKLSPDAVCGMAKLDHAFDVTICTKTAYNYIDLGLLSITNMDLLLKLRRSTHKSHVHKNRRSLGESIDERPKIVDTREEFGHWEMDTIVGKRKSGKVLLAIDERMTRNRHLIKIPRKTVADVREAIDKLKAEYDELFYKVFKTVTCDNGSEFSGLSEALEGVKVYYAHPCSPGERGTNEKQNSIVRRFIPKGKDIGTVSDYTIKKAEAFVNNLPRKILGYRTPQEMFVEQIYRLQVSA